MTFFEYGFLETISSLIERLDLNRHIILFTHNLLAHALGTLGEILCLGCLRGFEIQTRIFQKHLCTYPIFPVNLSTWFAHKVL